MKAERAQAIASWLNDCGHGTSPMRIGSASMSLVKRSAATNSSSSRSGPSLRLPAADPLEDLELRDVGVTFELRRHALAELVGGGSPYAYSTRPVTSSATGASAPSGYGRSIGSTASNRSNQHVADRIDELGRREMSLGQEVNHQLVEGVWALQRHHV
jgi:hypothetical protein